MKKQAICLAYDLFASQFSIQSILQMGKQYLRDITNVPSLEAEVLLAHVLQTSRAYLYTWPQQLLKQNQVFLFIYYLSKRFSHWPLAYITGYKEFWSLLFFVSPDVLIPRPETELLVELALSLAQFQSDSLIKVADLGCGSGVIALALARERPHWQFVATDVSAAALAIARRNALILGVDNIAFYTGYWCQALPIQTFDMIISNPPYLNQTEWRQSFPALCFEPSIALVAEENGLSAMIEIAITARIYLRPGGCLLLEHGEKQAQKVRECLSVLGYQLIRSVYDLGYKERVTLGYWLKE